MDGTGVIERATLARGPKPGRREAGDGRRINGTPPALGRLWADDAANGLGRRSPELSARSRAFPRLAALIAALLVVALAGLPLTGFTVLQLPLILCAPVFAGLILLRLAAMILPLRWAPRRDLPDTALPAASLLIALYDEAAIVPALVAGLKAIDYPRHLLDIKLVLEADDTATLAAIERVRLDARFEIVIVPPGRPHTKPRALNYALRFCRGEIVAVHDAEDRPHPRQLRTAAEAFSLAGADLACLQAPLNWYNRGETWLTRQFALEYASHFHAMLPLYRRLGWPLPLGGTSNYFRTAAVRRSGGWDAWNVTEDADLGIRLYTLGYRCDLIEPVTLEEAPVSVAAWLPQRTRWLKGYLQTLGVHAGFDRERRRLLLPLTFTLGGAVLSALLHGPATGMLVTGLLTGALPPHLVPLFAGWLGLGYAVSAACAAVAMKRAGLPLRAGHLLLLPAYWPLQTISAVRAVKQLVFTPYLWEKTAHGVSAMAGQACISRSLPHSSPSDCASPSSSLPDGGPASRCAPNADRA